MSETVVLVPEHEPADRPVAADGRPRKRAAGDEPFAGDRLFQGHVPAELSLGNPNCCCETREAIQGINYNMATNTCALQNTMNNNTRDLLENQNSNTRAILDFLTQDKIATLQAENTDLKRAASQDRQSALLTTAMASQTQQLINAINPAAIPAYVVPNPNTYYGGCGCNSGCC